MIDSIVAADSKFLPVDLCLRYSDEGFRAPGMNLDRIAFRTGLFIALLAKQEERAGVMISAGHHHKD